MEDKVLEARKLAHQAQDLILSLLTRSEYRNDGRTNRIFRKLTKRVMRRLNRWEAAMKEQQ